MNEFCCSERPIVGGIHARRIAEGLGWTVFHDSTQLSSLSVAPTGSRATPRKWVALGMLAVVAVAAGFAIRRRDRR